ncbi:MAG TPA: hypothetical protein PLA43_05840 [Bryobacteraceae bacterium]|nr:hypothetical protein [Bryobacteraceae bacterium]HOQ47525.1 hypothetical protein [Bryobacteraceae bacterium]HPU71458.1 hypothetical protein [Bryobacteraceae bacterium]
MKSVQGAALLAAAILVVSPMAHASAQDGLAGLDRLVRPKAGQPEIMKASEVKPGMKGVAWTVFAGTEPEPVPIEIIGLWQNAWGPKQDVILAKMGGKALRTNVAGGMSGSPVYIDGKLVGAVALRLSVFSPDAICGITPIELMLEINEFDNALPTDAKTPDKVRVQASLPLPDDMIAKVTAAGASLNFPAQSPVMVPIETPLTFSGFHQEVLREFAPLFNQLGLVAVQGGASGRLGSPKPAPGWEEALQPGDAVAGVLVSGDMSVTGLGTVTYNDGRRVLAFGHSFFNLGPVKMPMSKGEILFTNASSYQPNKFGNATEIVGALHQDRHSGILGVLGDEAEMVPVTVRVRSFGEDNTIRRQKDLHFNVFVQQKWTPYLMMLTLYNSISGLNDYREECTYRISGKVDLDGQQQMLVSTMEAPGELPVPAPMVLAGWWGDKFSRLFSNAVKTPRLKRVDATVDLLPERRIASIENAWIPATEVRPGDQVPIKVFLRPYRGPRIERTFNLKIPAGLPRGNHRILLSDAGTLNRMQTAAGMLNRYIDLPQVVSLINQERSNDKLYVSLVEARPTIYYDDKTLPSLPASVLNVMQTGRVSRRPFAISGESAVEQMAIPFEYVISGSYALDVTVK